MVQMSQSVVQLLVAVLVFFGTLCCAIDTTRCPRASPEEIWYSDYSPQLKFTVLEEMTYYFRLIFGRIEGDDLFTFIPYIKEDEEKAQNLTRRMAEVEKTALILMGKSYDVIEESWLSLGDTSSLFLAGAKLPGEVIRSMEDLQKAHVKANKILIEAGRQVSDFFRELLELSIEGVTQILETEVEEAPESDYAVAKLIQEKMIKMDPTNLIGIIARRFIGRSMGTVHSTPSKEPPNVLFAVMPRIDQIMADLKEMIDRQPLTVESWMAFWEDIFAKSLEVTKKREAAGQEDFVLIFRNEVYVAEVLMNMVTSYT